MDACIEAYIEVAVLENQFEAVFLESELKKEEIPCYIQSYFDTAYANVFQLEKGWGRIFSLPPYQSRILEILAGIRQESTV